MALFRTELRMAYERSGVTLKKWRTTFYVDEPSALDAADETRNAWENILRVHVRNFVFAYEVYATDMVEGTSNYHILPVDAEFSRGELTSSGDIYPIEHCLAVAVTVPASRPSRKFWRPGLLESDFTDGVFSNSTLAAQIQEDFDTMIEIGVYRDVDGETWGAVQNIKQSHRRLGRLAGFGLPVAPAGV